MKIFKDAFTLVELIVVITILVVLSTIGFISLSGYTQNTRDSVRLSDISAATKQLIIYQTKRNSLPVPQDMKNVIFSQGGESQTVFSQGTLGIFQSNLIGISEIKDPTTKKYYTYSTTKGGNSFQIGATLENSRVGIFPQAYVNSPEARVQGNYIPTPVIPGLIIAGSFEDNYILNQNLDTTYFVYDRGQNLPYNLGGEDVANIAYGNDTTKNYMSSLLAYYQLNDNGVEEGPSGKAVIKDKSGNNYDMEGIHYDHSPIEMSQITFQSGGILFSNDQSVGISGRFQHLVNENILRSEFERGFSIVSRVYNTNYTQNSQRIFSFIRYNTENGNIKYSTGFNPLRITGDTIHSIDAYYDDTNGDGLRDTIISNNGYRSEPEDYTPGYHTYITTYDYTKKERRVYKNAQLLDIQKITPEEADMNARDFTRSSLLISNVANESFHGSILTSMMYNRPLQSKDIKTITSQLSYFQ